jgi:spoIIIJ-associated protein
MERLTTLAREAAESLLTPLGFTFSLTTEPYEDGITLMIESPDARFLIGEEGDRLDDLQYMVNRLVQARWEDAHSQLDRAMYLIKGAILPVI